MRDRLTDRRTDWNQYTPLTTSLCGGGGGYDKSCMSDQHFPTISSHLQCLTHWGRVTHICVSTLTIIGSVNGLSPGRRQAIIWTNAGIFLIGPSGTYFSKILSEILTFSFKKVHLKMSSGKCRPFCLGLNVLNDLICLYHHQFRSNLKAIELPTGLRSIQINVFCRTSIITSKWRL